MEELTGKNYSNEYFIEEHIKNIFSKINDDEIKNLILHFINIDRDKINIKEIYKNYYILNNKTRSYMTEDDIYTNGMIKEVESGKLIKDFSIAFIIHKNKKLNIDSMDIIIAGNDEDEIIDVKRNLLPVYLSPMTLALI